MSINMGDMAKLINGHGSDITTLYCVLASLLIELRETQGDEFVQQIRDRAERLASMPRPPHVAPVNRNMLNAIFQPL